LWSPAIQFRTKYETGWERLEMYRSNYDICLADFEEDCFAEEATARHIPMVPSHRSRLVASFLVVLLGSAGVHRWYVGKTDTALSMLVLLIPSALAIWYPLGWLFLAVLTVWVAIDTVMILSGRMQDGRGKPIKNW